MTNPLTLRAAADHISQALSERGIPWQPTAIHATLKAMFSGRVEQFFSDADYTRTGKQGRVMLTHDAVQRYIDHKAAPAVPVVHDPKLVMLARDERVACMKVYKAQGMSLRAIGQAFGKSHEWVRTELEKEGV